MAKTGMVTLEKFQYPSDPYFWKILEDEYWHFHEQASEKFHSGAFQTSGIQNFLKPW